MSICAWYNIDMMSKRFGIVVFSVFLLAFSVSRFVFFADAASVDELNNQRGRLELKLAEINKQIKELQGQIGETQKQQASLKNELRIFDAQIRSTELAVEAKETQIEDAKLQIQELTRQVDRREGELQDQRTNLGKLVTMLHQMDESSGLQLAFGSDSFSSILDSVEYTSQLQHRVYSTVQKIKEVKSILEEQRSERTAQLRQQEELKADLEEQRVALNNQRSSRQKLLEKTKGVEKNYQNLLAANKQAGEDLESEIQNLDAQVEAQLGKRTIQPNSSSLIKPMAGVLTQKYGPTNFKALGYSVHNGLDIAAPAGTPIYAAASGEVTACNSSNASYGNWCTVKHKIETKTGSRCIISLYAHMQSYKVSAGKSVAQGDLIGYEGNTGNTTRLLYGPTRGFHLHFTIFDCEGFGIAAGKYSKTYGDYKVPYGYTYNPADFFQ